MLQNKVKCDYFANNFLCLEKSSIFSSKPTAAAAPMTNIWEERKKLQKVQVSQLIKIMLTCTVNNYNKFSYVVILKCEDFGFGSFTTWSLVKSV